MTLSQEQISKTFKLMQERSEAPKLTPEQLNAIDLLISVSYTHLRAHETVLDLVCRLLLEKKNSKKKHKKNRKVASEVKTRDDRTQKNKDYTIQ